MHGGSFSSLPSFHVLPFNGKFVGRNSTAVAALRQWLCRVWRVVLLVQVEVQCGVNLQQTGCCASSALSEKCYAFLPLKPPPLFLPKVHSGGNLHWTGCCTFSDDWWITLHFAYGIQAVSHNLARWVPPDSVVVEALCMSMTA